MALSHVVSEIFNVKKCCDLENRVRGSSRSLKMSPFARAHMTSYRRSIVNMVLYRVVYETFSVEKYRDFKFRPGSFKVIESGTIR